MCCRYVLLQQHLREVLAKLGVTGSAAAGALPRTRYNIPPGSGIPAVRQAPRRATAPAAARELAILHWGLVPAWARSADDAPVNARAETLAERPSFRDAFRARRCLIPASGFYEWQARSRSRLPWHFRRRDGAGFCFAGVWEAWRAPDGTVLESCAVITTAPNALMAPIHHRMPAIVREEHYERWLDPRATSAAQLAPLLQPFPADALHAQPLATRVNDVAHDDAECLAPAGDFSPDDDPQFCLRLD